MRVSVWVDSWQQQCCGADFGIGDAVQWQLTVAGEQLTADLADVTLPAVGPLVVLGDLRTESVAGPGKLLAAGGLRAFVREQGAFVRAGSVGRRVTLFAEDHHVGVPPDLPTTDGTVHRIRLVRYPYVFDETRHGWMPQPGGARTTDATAAERWPEQVVDGARFRGFLVDLEIADR